VPRGSVVGVDASTQMVEFARDHFAASHPNLAFRAADAAGLRFRDEFDLVVSFNALHWVIPQAAALAGIREALRQSGRALLQMVSQGERKSLEDVLEDTARSPRWAKHFAAHTAPFVHFTDAQYRELARQGFAVDTLETELVAWDFGSRDAFVGFARVTFAEWTRSVPAAEQLEFIHDVLDRYRGLGDGTHADAAVFHFYQMRVGLRPT
jgi:trans-aconitate 2-methyltransferase